MQRFLALLRLLLLVILLLLLSETGSVIFAQSEPGVLATTRIRVNLRDGPGTDWYVLGIVEAGETLRLDGRAPYDNNLWVRGITYDGRVGWIYGDYINAPLDQVYALPQVWIDDPFTLPPAPPPSPTSPPTASPAPEQAAPVEIAAVPVDPAQPAPAQPPAPAAPTVSVISGISATARNIFISGQQMGNRPNVFSKIGDSITVAPQFLYPIGAGLYNLQGYAQYQAVINYFSSATARTSNSFANESLAANGGWTTQTALDPNAANRTVCFVTESPLVCEYRIVKPALALIMLGTNDTVAVPLPTYRANLGAIVQTSIQMGVIPVLSTIPPRFQADGTVAAYNQAVIETARAYDIPLWDYHSSMVGIYAGGLSQDGLHPSAPPGSHPNDIAQAANFTPENLNYGYTMRNLGALQVLDAIWQQALY